MRAIVPFGEDDLLLVAAGKIPDADRGPRRLDRQVLQSPRPSPASRRAAAHPARPREMRKARKAEIALDRMIEDEALHLPILRHERDALLDRLRRSRENAEPRRESLSSPLAIGRRPNSVSRISVRPLPISPASPWISPSISVRSTPRKRSLTSAGESTRSGVGGAGPSRLGGGRGFVGDARFRGAHVSGPTIAATSVFMSVSAVLNVPTFAPSRRTVTRCEMRNTSFSRCVT